MSLHWLVKSLQSVFETTYTLTKKTMLVKLFYNALSVIWWFTSNQKPKQNTQKTAIWSLKKDTNQPPLSILMIKHLIIILKLWLFAKCKTKGTHKISSLQHIQYKRWKWQQANEPKRERSFKGSKSTMAVTSMGIKTTSTLTTTTTTAAKRTAKQSSRQAASVWRSSAHASEWEVGWTSTWPRLWMSPCAVCVCVCLSRSLPAFQYLLCLSLTLIYPACLSVFDLAPI